MNSLNQTKAHHKTNFDWLFLVSSNTSRIRESDVQDLFEAYTHHTESPITAFINLLGTLSVINHAHPLWWATDIASRNRINALTITEADNWITISKILSFAEKQQFGIRISSNAPPLLARATYIYAKEKGISTEYKSINMSIKRLGQIQKLLKESLRSTKWILMTKLLYGHYTPSKKPVHIIKSFTYKSAFQKKEKYNDPFFGTLSYHIENMNKNSITIIQGFSDRLDCYALISPNQRGKIIPFEIFQSILDPITHLFSVVFTGIFNPLKFPRKLYLQQELLPSPNTSLTKINWAPLAQVALEDAIWTIQLPQLMAEVAGRRIASRYNIESLLMTCEANPWEFMFIKGLRSVTANLSIKGYQHSVVPPAALGMFTTKEEQTLRPSPDIIFTTGIAPMRMLERYGNGNRGRTRPACALRYEYLFKSPPKKHRQQPIKKILVALEGLIEVADLVTYLFKEAPKNPTVNFIIRSHPVLPLKQILTHLQFSNQIPDNIMISNYISVEEDLQNCDAVLYWGTTVSLESILYGKPIIHFSKGGIFNYDPLVELKNFKLCTDSHKPLKESITTLDSWSQKIFEREKSAAQKYVYDYFHPVNTETMSLFMH
ncbi:hypothetical protein O4H49_16245 [Kiloniella laminariae]|uniref:Capsule polysaccharide biosynthesis protein n=1 Tax=Kiloniella laminariae TaxID=454162 RepID=A0ABT4LMI5_9PROT|nr:hypothetical protein [Kiloniella laminariae]MCZ4282338.1 hypothetical protein [Kiloniella laminariae]